MARTLRTGHPATDELFDETVGKLAASGVVVHDVTPPRPTPAEDNDEDIVLLCELLDGLAAYLPTRGPAGPQNLPEVIEHENQNAATELAHFGHDMFERAVALGGCDTEVYRAARARNLAMGLGHVPAARDGQCRRPRRPHLCACLEERPRPGWPPEDALQASRLLRPSPAGRSPPLRWGSSKGSRWGSG